jgi:hypothetical protein
MATYFTFNATLLISISKDYISLIPYALWSNDLISDVLEALILRPIL